MRDFSKKSYPEFFSAVSFELLSILFLKIQIQIHSKNFLEVPKFSPNFYRFSDIKKKMRDFPEKLMCWSYSEFTVF